MKSQINQKDQVIMTQEKRIKEMKQKLEVFNFIKKKFICFYDM